jgi:hypothetical protein
MPVLRSKTVRDENEMIAFLESEAVPGFVGGPDYTTNASGWISVFYNDAHRDRATTPIYGAPTGAAADQTTYDNALTSAHYSTAINVANASKIIIGIEVISPATSKALHLNLRLSNLGDPSLTTATHWFQQLVAPNYSSSKYDVDVAEYVFKRQLLTAGAKFTLELPVAANWANIVIHNCDASARFKIYADIG